MLVLALLGAATCGAAAAEAGRFGVLSDPSRLRSCSVGRVVAFRAGRQARVRSESRPRARVTGRLERGEYLLICNEDRDEHYRHWYGIVYSRPGNACRTGLPRRPLSFNGSCRSGWVRREWVTVLTG